MASPTGSHVLRCFCKAKAVRQPLQSFRSTLFARQDAVRLFHASARRDVVKPFLLADVGEGITEVQIVQWYIQPGARVAQFDKICDVVSDKASVEITSRFDGVIKKLHYEADDIAQVGKPLVDIDIEGEITPELQELTDTSGDSKESSVPSHSVAEQSSRPAAASIGEAVRVDQSEPQLSSTPQTPSGKHATLATPAVRHLTKELNLNIEDIRGTGKDGRVLKEDVQRYASSSAKSDPSTPSQPPLTPLAEDKVVPLTPIQTQMFKTMTRSLQIPHFLYSDPVDFTELNRVRYALNTHHSTFPQSDAPKLSALPFIIKAVSLSLINYPAINAHLDADSESKPRLIHKAAHNIGIAIDSPSGLIVPVIKNVQSHSIISVALEIQRLSSLAHQNKLATSDLSGATFTVSNVGSIGGHVVAPVIVSPQIAILGVGKAKAVPAFDAKGNVVRKDEAVFSWSADHRVIDGATVARFAQMVKGYLEEVERMIVRLR